jgi:hypothetical protein
MRYSGLKSHNLKAYNLLFRKHSCLHPSARARAIAVGVETSVAHATPAKLQAGSSEHPSHSYDHTFSTIEDAISAIARGEFVLVLDDEDRENEGDLIIAAEKVTPQKIAYMVNCTSGETPQDT